ncbi:hypothetical protein LEP1GSC035_1735 [Leptospira noguchii str. 2007001578]|uniref:Uncharacterized protein n=2 Tax=Leptospira noguchii TaxID=28182 RepID=A0ABP2TDJ4_9LEPT|nr:hypothetical protein LEP1GSC035_1735 [Leptospira noguchii str. 2007001578]
MASELVTNYGSKKITICNWTVEPKKTGKKYEFLHFQGNQKDIYFWDIHSLWQMTKIQIYSILKIRPPLRQFPEARKNEFLNCPSTRFSPVVVTKSIPK